MVYEYCLVKKTLDNDLTEVNFVDFDVVSDVLTDKLVEEATDLLKLLILGCEELPVSTELKGEDVVKIQLDEEDLKVGVVEF